MCRKTSKFLVVRQGEWNNVSSKLKVDEGSKNSFMKRQLSAPQIAVIVAALTLGSKLIGFAREVIKADYYGTTYVVDSLGIAENIPNMIFVGILSATATSFMPLFSGKIEKEGETAADRYTSQVINILAIICVISSLVGILLSAQIVTLFTMPDIPAPVGSNPFGRAAWFVTHGWTGEKAALASSYVNVTFSYTLFSSVSGILESYIKYKGVFIRQVLAGYSFSALIIIGLLASHAVGNPRLIVYGSLAGNIARLIIIALIAKREKYKYTPDFHLSDTVKSIFAMALPIFIGASVWQISSFVDNTLASGLDTGNVASLSYAALVIGLAMAFSGIVISTIIYPKMSQAYAQGDEDRYSLLFTNGLATSVMIGAPVTFAFMLYSNQVIQIVFERGAFSGSSTELTARAFFYLAPGLVFGIAVNIMTSALYSRKKTAAPMAAAIIAICVNIILDLLLIGRYGNAGLATATSLSQISNALLLAIFLRRLIPWLITKDFVRKCVRIAIASAVSVGGTAPIYFGVMSFAAANAWIMPRAALLLVTAIVAIVIYMLLLRALKVDEVKHFREIAGMFRRGGRGESERDE
jgi:putative peptidoglycan lipid II flippase